MRAVTFDALKFVDVLEQAKLPREQARAIVDVVRESRETALDVRTNMDVRFAKVDGELKLLKWTMGMLITINLTVLAGVASLVVMLIKAFF